MLLALALTHFQALALFSFFSSLVFTFLTKHDARERARYFAWSFGLFMLAGLGLGWLMYPFPR